MVDGECITAGLRYCHARLYFTFCGRNADETRFEEPPQEMFWHIIVKLDSDLPALVLDVVDGDKNGIRTLLARYVRGRPRLRCGGFLRGSREKTARKRYKHRKRPTF